MRTVPTTPRTEETRNRDLVTTHIIGAMLSFEVHRELAELTSAVHRVTNAAIERAPSDEIELRVDAALSSAGRLEAMIGGQFYGLRRHLGWLRKRHREGRPNLADSDVADLREHDLAEAIDAVEKWSHALLDPALVACVEGSWRAQQYDAAVREAFVFLEQRMRGVAAVSPAEGVVGRRLVTRLLPGSGPSDRWSPDGFMGHLSDGEQGGARELLNGSLALFRNATAHRTTAYSREEAEDLVHLVNLCLRLVAKVRIPPDEADDR
jgi:Protein of unknown function (Hypoth_ymh)